LNPEARLKREGEDTVPERWTLTRLNGEVTTHDEVPAVATTIQRSRFVR